jgi:hypothetical protein
MGKKTKLWFCIHLVWAMCSTSSASRVSRNIFKNRIMPGVLVDTCNTCTQEVEARGLRVWGQPGLHSETLSQKTRNFCSYINYYYMCFNCFSSLNAHKNSTGSFANTLRPKPHPQPMKSQLTRTWTCTCFKIFQHVSHMYYTHSVPRLMDLSLSHSPGFFLNSSAKMPWYKGSGC